MPKSKTETNRILGDMLRWRPINCPNSSVVPSLDFDEEGVYTRLGVSDLNPDEMEVWENSLLSLAGHSGVTTTQEEHWLSTVSHTSDHRLDSAVRGTWTLDASEPCTQARTDIDSLFSLTSQIRIHSSRTTKVVCNQR